MVCLVRSEDRKPSRRVFPLLQNLDLDTVTFAQVQSTGEPITIQDMNEQEMLDLIIVNLARLAVAGEWTGLLEAGGGEFNVEMPGVSLQALGVASRHPVGSYAPYGQGDLATFIWYNNDNYQKTLYYPFIAPVTGTVSEFGIQITAAAAASCNLLIGIYSDDGDGAPLTLQMSGEIDVENSGTGSVYQTSITADVSTSITRGTQYWVAMNRDTDSVQFTLKSYALVGTSNVGPSTASSLSADDAVILRTIDKPLALVATEVVTNLIGYQDGKCVLTLKVS